MSSPGGTPTTRDAAPGGLRLVQTLDDDGVASPAATPAASEPAPSRVGRFALIGQIGRGGMGVVYAAWDPQLDRKVAIKLVLDDRFADAEDARHRLEQEARAAATLNHPNIVTIYDTGVHEGRVFLAMEYVEGCTLAGWLAKSPRRWDEVVEMFLQVGRGLAAAHAMGLVHRDFKPDNVLVGDEPGAAMGRPRVADFGLAYSREDRRDPHATTLGGASKRTSEREGTPAIAGTPAYMAPEQFDGLEIGPAADQFAFCTALFEGLFGRRPYTAGSYHALSVAVHAGEIALPDDRPAVPKRLVELVLRGLAPDPAARHASLDVLLDGMRRVLAARRRRGRVAGAIVAGACALGIGFAVARSAEPTPCADTEDAAALWSASDREAVRAAVGAAGDAVVAELDLRAQAWADKRREVCEASRVTGEQSDEAMQLRMACLDRAAGRFRGLTDELVDASDATGIDAAAITHRLPPGDQCDDVESLAKLTNRNASRSSRSTTEQDRAWTEAVELVERALVRRLLGTTDARAPAERAAELARIHGLPGVRSRALGVLADLELDAGRSDIAQALRRDAARFAVADGHEDAAVHLMLDEADAALLDDRVAEAELHMGYYDAFVEAMHDAEARADLDRRAQIVRGRLAIARGDAAGALERLASLPFDALSDLDRRAAWMALGTAQRSLGDADAATATWTQLLALVERLRGATHPDVAAVLNNLALVRLDALDAAAAEALLVRAEDITKAASGDDAPLLATIATNRGWAARVAGRHADAHRHLDRALELGTARFGPRHPSLAYALDQHGELARAEGRLDAALQHFGRAGELRDATLGPNHPETATTLVGMARVFLAKGDHVQAKAALEVALRILDAHPGPPRRRAHIEALLEIAASPPVATASPHGR
jgi:tetratricopeptide (TPR) repeat protein